MKYFIILLLSLVLNIQSLLAAGPYPVDEVKVYKSKHRMDMIHNGKVVKSYRVSLGRGGMGPKREQGDKKVPEGKYILDYKNPYSNYYKSIHISYPNEEDIKRAYEAGVDPGGDIMIHGYPNKQNPLFWVLKKFGLMKIFDWTQGCVAVKDREMDEIYKSIEIPTPITIYP